MASSPMQPSPALPPITPPSELRLNFKIHVTRNTFNIPCCLRFFSRPFWFSFMLLLAHVKYSPRSLACDGQLPLLCRVWVLVWPDEWLLLSEFYGPVEDSIVIATLTREGFTAIDPGKLLRQVSEAEETRDCWMFSYKSIASCTPLCSP